MENVIKRDGYLHESIARSRPRARAPRVRLAALEQPGTFFNIILEVSLFCYCKLLMLCKTIGLLPLLPRGRCAPARTRRCACASPPPARACRCPRVSCPCALQSLCVCVCMCVHVGMDT